MLVGRLTTRHSVLAACLAMSASAGHTWAQSNASLTTDVGSTMTLTIDFSAMTVFGPISGSDTDTTDVVGTARITLFPTDPPFSHCRMQALSMALGDIELHYFFNSIHATFTDLLIESAQPFGARIHGDGYAYFPVSYLRVTGTVHLYSANYSLDEILPLDVTTSAPMTTSFEESGGSVVLGQLDIPTVEWVIPPELLPSGFSALDVAVDADGSGVTFRGPYAPAMLGDGDADDDVDLRDFSNFLVCYGGPDEPQVPLCGLFMFDEGDDVDLDDYAAFRAVFEGPR